MFSMICNSDRKLASSPYSEGKPPTGTMDCCNVQAGRRLQRSWWHGTSGCVGSGILLVLLPKCPMCIAAYLTLWTGGRRGDASRQSPASDGGGFVLCFSAFSGCAVGGESDASGEVSQSRILNNWRRIQFVKAAPTGQAFLA